MTKLSKLKFIIQSSKSFILKEDGVIMLELEFSSSSFDSAFELAVNDLIRHVYTLHNGTKTYEKVLSAWNEVPEAIKKLGVLSYFIEMNFKELRREGVHVYINEHELIELCPIAPEHFLIFQLSLNSNKCTICPTEYNKNEIHRYFQLKEIWRLLSSYADDSKESELIFLFKNKLTLKLNYSFEDLAFEFDGMANLLNINKEEGHAGAKKNIMQNTLHSILWREDSQDSLKKLLKDFTLFAKTFEENFRAYTVSFSFDNVRKEYVEKFREYLSKMNSMIYDSLTRALAIPISGVIGFATMNNSDSKTTLANFAALVLVVFSTIATHFLVLFQIKMVSVTRKEFSTLFYNIRKDLKRLYLPDLMEKEKQLNFQADIVSKLLLSIYSIAFTNLIINTILFIINWK